MSKSRGAYGLLGLACGLALLGCGGASTPTAATPVTPTPAVSPQTASYAGTLAAGGSAAHPFTAERSGTLTATMTTSAPLDMSFFIARSGVGCTRTDSCAFLVRPNASKQLTYSIAKGESIAFILWHVYDVEKGEARDYSIDVVVQ